ncbi:Aspartic peptidase domain, partial [Cinara cedri]
PLNNPLQFLTTRNQPLEHCFTALQDYRIILYGYTYILLSSVSLLYSNSISVPDLDDTETRFYRGQPGDMPGVPAASHNVTTDTRTLRSTRALRLCRRTGRDNMQKRLENESDSDNDVKYTFEINQIKNDGINEKKWFQTIFVNGIEIHFQLDSGAETNILPLRVNKVNVKYSIEFDNFIKVNKEILESICTLPGVMRIKLTKGVIPMANSFWTVPLTIKFRLDEMFKLLTNKGIIIIIMIIL